MKTIINYLREAKGEMKHVNWPSRTQTIWFTVLVIVISVLVAYILGFFDFLFSTGLAKILER